VRRRLFLGGEKRRSAMIESLMVNSGNKDAKEGDRGGVREKLMRGREGIKKDSVGVRVGV